MNPKKAKADTKTTTKATTKATGVKRATSKQQDKQEEQQQQQYFLMKSEPESRIQNGQEMKFSIDDLIKEPDSTTHWDGVRNYEARNIMKEMNIGDRAFFYHSNCKKSQPAIVGQVEIVRQAYPDHTAFDREDVHFDPKSDKKNPKWFMVDVKFEKKFKQEVTLKDVKDCAQLQNMQLVKRGRISVQRVTPREWTSVLKMAGEPVPDDGDDDDDGSEEEEDDDENDDE